MGGSSKKQTIGYKYYLGMHLAFVHGPIDKLVALLVDKRPAWLGESTGGPITIAAESLFGGKKREGGISGTVDFENGNEDQTKNDYLQSQLGADIPAFRRIACLVLRQCYLGINPYLKSWSARMQRIHVRQGGIEQWYDAKAEILASSEEATVLPITANGWQYIGVPYAANPGYDEIAIPSSGWSAGVAGPFGGGDGVPAHNGLWPVKTSIWIRKQVELTFGRYILSVTAENGCTVYVNGALLGGVNRSNVQIAAEETVAFYLQGSSFDIAIKAYDETFPLLGGTYLAVKIEKAITADMNPAHIIRECLTDPDWGMGYQDADIDDVSFMAAADSLYDEQMGISLIWDKQGPIEDFIKEILRHINASLFVDRTNGKFVLKLIRNDFIEDDLLILNESNVEKVEGYSRPAFGELTNSINVNFWDVTTGNTASVSVQDAALIQLQQAVIGTTIQFPGFTNYKIAARVAQRSLQALSIPLVTCTIYANRDASELNIGDAFKFEWPDYHDDYIVMRVTGIAFGDGRKNTIRINCIQDAFFLPSVVSVSQPDGGWVDPSQVPSLAQYRAVVEAPYYELVQRAGQSTTDNQLSLNPELGYVLASAARPANAMNAIMSIDDGSGYEDKATVEFCPFALLSADIGFTDTSILISNGRDLDLIALGSHIQIDDEILRLDAVSDTAMTVGRGVLDTVPAKHYAGASILAWDAYARECTTEYVQGEILNVKLLPASGAGVVLPDSVTADSIEMEARAIRPYPPGNFKINGAYFPTTIISEVALTWAHRDRLLQTSGSLISFESGNVGPEAGTTYNARFYNSSNALLRSVTGISGASYTYAEADEIADSGTATLNAQLRIELESMRSGYSSWQMYNHTILRNIPPPITYTYSFLNPNDKASTLTLSGGNLTAVRNAGASGWGAVRSAVGKNKGKWYFEVTNNANGSTDGDAIWGFMRNTNSLATYPGNSTLGLTSMGWESNLTPNSGKFQNGSLGAVAGYGKVAAGQSSFFAIDIDAGKLWVKNSAAAGWAGGGDPAAGTTPTFTFAANTHLHFSLAAFSNPQSATVNFGASAFVGLVPSGFTSGWKAPSVPITPVYSSRFNAASTADAQGVATDGTHVWFSSSSTIYKYTKAGVLVTSRNVSGDAPATKTQINGMFFKDGVLYVSAAENSTPRKTYIVQYNPDTLAYITHNQITGDWFSEGLTFKSGYWWICFHANKVIAQVDPSTWAVAATFNLTFNVTGSSGGYGSGTGYDGLIWWNDYLLCNIHETYDQDYLDVYYFDGNSFVECGRLARPTSISTQAFCIDPVETGVLWFAERNYSGVDSVAKITF